MWVDLPQTPAQWHRRIWALTWPMILANLTIPMVGAVDTAVMGRLPDAAYIGAVAVGSTILTAIYWIFGFLRMGTTGLTAQAMGRRDLPELVAVGGRAAILALLLGLALVVTQQPLHDLAFWIFQASSQVESLASDYFLIRIWGAPAAFVHLVNLGILFGLQRMGATLVISVLLNVSNVALDLLFVIGFGWGVEGVAIGTIVSEWLAAIVGVIIVIKALEQSGWPRTRPAGLLNRHRLTDLFRVSGNLIVRSFFVQFPFMTYTALSASLGDLVLAANAILMQFFLVMAYGLDSVANTTETLTGHAFGARNSAQLRTASAYAFMWGGLMAFGATVVYAVFGDAIVSLMTRLPEVREAANQYRLWATLAPMVCVWAFLFDGIFIGTTRTVELRNSMFAALVIYLLTLWLTFDALGNNAIWLAMMTFMVARSILLGAHYPKLLRLAASKPDV